MLNINLFSFFQFYTPNFKRVFAFLMIFFIAAFTLSVFAQTVDTTGLGGNTAFEGERPDTGELLNIYYLLLGALTLAWGVIAKAFGLKERVNKFVWVVVAGGVVLIGGFMSFGWVEFLPSVFTLLSSMGIFDVLKGMTANSPKYSALLARLEALELKISKG